MANETVIAELAALKAQQVEIRAQMVRVKEEGRKDLGRRVVDFLEREGISVSDALIALKLIRAENTPTRQRRRRATAVVSDDAPTAFQDGAPPAAQQ